MYNTPVPLPPRKGVSVFFMFFDVIAKSESYVKHMPKVVHAKLTTMEGILFSELIHALQNQEPWERDTPLLRSIPFLSDQKL